MEKTEFQSETHDQGMKLHDVHAALHTLMTGLDPASAEWQKLYRVQRNVSVAIDEMRDMLNPPKSAFPTTEEQAWIDHRASEQAERDTGSTLQR